jgi:hypothetical protein
VQRNNFPGRRHPRAECLLQNFHYFQQKVEPQLVGHFEQPNRKSGLGLHEEAAAVHRAIEAALERGARTADLAQKGTRALGTREMTRAIADEVAAATTQMAPGREAACGAPQ